MGKCVICEHRPARDGGYCPQCSLHIASMKKVRNDPQYFLTYREHVVGLYPTGKGTLKARLLKRSSEHLPKRKTIDLNRWCDGYSRVMIKRFKACVLQVAHA